MMDEATTIVNILNGGGALNGIAGAISCLIPGGQVIGTIAICLGIVMSTLASMISNARTSNGVIIEGYAFVLYKIVGR